jgi:hypothetical protein
MSKLAHSNQPTMDLIAARRFLGDWLGCPEGSDPSREKLFSALYHMNTDDLMITVALGLQEREERAEWPKKQIEETVAAFEDSAVRGVPLKTPLHYRVPDIIVKHVYPPIPIRSFDWKVAYEDIGEEDQIVSWGATPEAAVNDLLSEHPWVFVVNSKGHPSK